jgi:hypothetical protein
VKPINEGAIMTRTAEMVAKYLDGFEVVVSGGPVFTGRKDGRWPVLYTPRHRTDPRPFQAVGSGFRYTGGELNAIKA